jgi:hypothetical protein
MYKCRAFVETTVRRRHSHVSVQCRVDFGTAAFVRMIPWEAKTVPWVRLSVLARNVTTALSMVLTAMIEAIFRLPPCRRVDVSLSTYGKIATDSLKCHGSHLLRFKVIGCFVARFWEWHRFLDVSWMPFLCGHFDGSDCRFCDNSCL